MIEVTKLNDEKVTVNADLIEMIEEVPEILTFQVDELFKQSIRSSDNTRVRLETSLRNNHIGKLVRKIHIRHLDEELINLKR